MTNSVDPDQTGAVWSDLSLRCLLKPICPKTWDHYGNTKKKCFRRAPPTPFIYYHTVQTPYTLHTVMIQSFRTGMPGQTVQTKIRLLLIRVYTVYRSVCIIWTHYSMVEPHSSNFRVITTNFLGVQIFRKGHLCLWWDDSLKKKYNTKYYKIYFYLIFRAWKYVSMDKSIYFGKF